MLTRSEAKALPRLTEAAKEVMQEQYRALVRRADGSPIMFDYVDDETPALPKMNETARLDGAAGGESLVSRAGKLGHALLVQRLLVTAEIEGEGWKVVPVLREPLSLASKTAAAVHACQISFVKTPRDMGHMGIEALHFT